MSDDTPGYLLGEDDAQFFAFLKRNRPMVERLIKAGAAPIQPRRTGSDQRPTYERFIARIGAATQDGTNKRWTYAFTEIKKHSAGYGGWVDLSGGRTGSAYNLNEDQNGASGTYGNGVSSTNLVGTIDVQPIPSGTRVEITTVIYSDGDTNSGVEYWITGLPNGVDGGCP